LSAFANLRVGDFSSAMATTQETREVWYRYVDVQYAYVDPDTDLAGPGRTDLQLKEFLVERRTPKCVVLRQTLGEFTSQETHVVRLSARKRFAHPTKGEALESFKARKSAQIRMLEAQLDRARSALGLARVLDAAAYPAGHLKAQQEA
jgi:hypothetical protein